MLHSACLHCWIPKTSCLYLHCSFLPDRMQPAACARWSERECVCLSASRSCMSDLFWVSLVRFFSLSPFNQMSFVPHMEQICGCITLEKGCYKHGWSDVVRCSQDKIALQYELWFSVKVHCLLFWCVASFLLTVLFADCIIEMGFYIHCILEDEYLACL